MIPREVPFDSDSVRRRYTLGGLKVCPVCGTLNTEEAFECFVCWWHGAFEDDPSFVEFKLAELARRCPELVGLLEEPPRPVNRFVLAVRRLWSRVRTRLDVSI